MQRICLHILWDDAMQQDSKLPWSQEADGLIIYHEDGDTRFLQNVSELLWEYVTYHPTTPVILADSVLTLYLAVNTFIQSFYCLTAHNISMYCYKIKFVLKFSFESFIQSLWTSVWCEQYKNYIHIVVQLWEYCGQL